MKKSLAFKVAPWIFVGLGLIGNGCAKTYEIDGNKVKKRPFVTNNIVEKRGDNFEIKYSLHPSFSLHTQDIFNVKINGEEYTKEDALVYKKANERYHYLINKIDSIETAQKNNEIYKIDSIKIAQEHNRINYGLKALE